MIYKQDYSIKELEKLNNTKVLVEKEEEIIYLDFKDSQMNFEKKSIQEKPIINLPKEFIEAFRTKMKEVEDHFLENRNVFISEKTHFKMDYF